MKRLFSLRGLLSLVILLIAVSSLVSSIKVSVLDEQAAAFFPVAAFAVTLSYVLGSGSWSARRCFFVVVLCGLVLAFIESTKLIAPIRDILRSIPQLEVSLLRSLLEKEALDISRLQAQFAVVVNISSAFASQIFNPKILNTTVGVASEREFFWDLILIFLGTWTGWASGRRGQSLLALAPSLAFHAYILNYSGQETTSLQIGVFALILLIGLNGGRSLSHEKSENSARALRETYTVILLLAIALAIAAGITPSISIKEIVQKIHQKNELAKSLGLQKQMAQAYSISGLPRQHLIGLSPKLSQMVVFTVRTGEIPAAENAILDRSVPRHYWRWLSYDIYDGQGWATSAVENDSYNAAESLFPNSSEGYQVIHQRVEKVLPQDSRLYWTGFLTGADQSFNASWRQTPRSLPAGGDAYLRADMLGAITDKQTYQANSIIPIVSASELRAAPEQYPPEVRVRYLQLPSSVPQRVLDLARQLTAGIADPYDKAKVIESYLRQYPYTLALPPPPQGRDIADYFLFDLKKGYCDYYATSMVVMARAVGLPARLVIGYANGIYDPNAAKYIVHESDAHSWVEVYFGGVGWVEFEPTASQLALTLPDDLPTENISAIVPFSLPTSSRSSDYTKRGIFAERQPFPFAIVFALLMGFFAAWFLFNQGLLQAHTSIASIYEYVFYQGRKLYKDAPLHETPSIFAEHLRMELRSGYPWLIPAPAEIKVLTDLYIKETYSPHPISEHERALAVKVWSKLFWRLLYARFVLARSS